MCCSDQLWGNNGFSSGVGGGGGGGDGDGDGDGDNEMIVIVVVVMWEGVWKRLSGATARLDVK